MPGTQLFPTVSYDNHICRLAWEESYQNGWVADYPGTQLLSNHLSAPSCINLGHKHDGGGDGDGDGDDDDGGGHGHGDDVDDGGGEDKSKDSQIQWE